MKAILSIIISGALVVSGYTQTRNVLVGTNNTVVQPTNFWSADASNARTGLGLGSAATNPASAFQSSSSVLSNLASSNAINLTNLRATNIVGVIPSSNIPTVSLTNISGTLAITQGGTGATNAGGARTNLELVATWLTNTNVTNFRTAIGLGPTNDVAFDQMVASDLVGYNLTVEGAIYFTEVLTNIGVTRTNLGLGWSALTNTNAGTGLVSVNTNGDVVSPTNFWQNAPIQTLVQDFTGITVNQTNNATNARNVYVYSLATNVGGISNTIILPTNASTFNGDEITVIHKGTTNTTTVVRQAGSTNNFITLNKFDESVKFIRELGQWDFYHNISFVEPIQFSGTNASVNAAASRTNFGLGATNDIIFNSVQLGTNDPIVSIDNQGLFIESTNTNTGAAAINFVGDGAEKMAANTRFNLGLGATNDVAFRSITLSRTALATNFALGFLITNTIPTTNTNVYGFAWANENSGRLSYIHANNTVFIVDEAEFRMSVPFSFTNQTTLAQTRTNLGLGATWLTNTNVTNFRTAVGLGVTNNVEFNELRLGNSGQMHIRGAAGNISFYNDIESENVLLIPADTDPVEINSQWNNGGVRSNLGLPLAALTNTSNTTFQQAIFTTNAAPTNTANVNGIGFNTAVSWMAVNIVTNGVTNTFQVPLFK